MTESRTPFEQHLDMQSKPTIWPWNDSKSCPKCNHPNLTGRQKYVVRVDVTPEHLVLACAVCNHTYCMEVKAKEPET